MLVLPQPLVDGFLWTQHGGKHLHGAVTGASSPETFCPTEVNICDDICLVRVAAPERALRSEDLLRAEPLHAFPSVSPHLAGGPNLSCVESYLPSPSQTALPRAGPPPAAQSPRQAATLRGRSTDTHESIHSYPEERFEKASQCRRPRHFRQNFFPPDHHWGIRC